MNSVNLMGRLTKDVELKNTAKGNSFCRFNIAVTRDKDNTDFIPCVAFNKTAELINQYVRKGDQIGVEGRLSSGSYENDQGRTVYTLNVTVNRIDFGAKKQGNNQSNGYQQNSYQPQPGGAYGIDQAFEDEDDIYDFDSDDLPF